jgi:IPT/TIG domain
VSPHTYAWPNAAILFLVILMLLLSGCGGGSGSAQASATVPAEDFSVVLSSSTLVLSQGSTAAPIQISLIGKNGFDATVPITLSGLPQGVISNIEGSFTLATGASTSLVLGAARSTAPGAFTITASATSGALSHSATLALTIKTSILASLPRTSYVRTDSTIGLDNPSGEPRRRRIAFDSINKHVFVANPAMNRVEVFSNTSQTRMSSVDVPGASSVDISADGSTIWVGTTTQQVVAIDTSSLQVKARHPIQPLSPIPNTVFDLPDEVLSAVNGNCLIRLRASNTSESLLAVWDPVASTVADLTPTLPQIFESGLGVMTASGDHSHFVVAANDSSGQVAVFDSNGNIVAGPVTLGTGTIPLVAANQDASRFGVVFVSNGTPKLLLLDGLLNLVGGPITSLAVGLTFSQDAKVLYVSQQDLAVPGINAYDGGTLAYLGEVPDAIIEGVNTQIEAADETRLLFGVGNRGVSFIDAANPGTLSAPIPSLGAAPVGAPSDGPTVGGTSVTLSGQNFASAPYVSFGGQLGSALSVVGPTQMAATSPPTTVTGSVNVSAYFPGGWVSIAPEAFSYGPQILEMLPNAGSPIGGDTVQLYGFGFAGSGVTTVTFGGATAKISSIETAASLGFDPTYPFSLEKITLKTPVGTSGNVDVVVTTPAGSATASQAFQYLQGVNVYANPGLYTFVLYDQKRQVAYLSATDHVDAVNLAIGAFLPGGLPLECELSPGNTLSGPCPDADVRGLALTPDASQLVVADFGSQNIYLLDPDSPGTVSFVPVTQINGIGPARVATTNTQTVFVGLAGQQGVSGACSNCLSQLSLSATPVVGPAPQPEIAALSGAPIVQGNAAGDRVTVAFTSATGGPIALWNSASPNDFAVSAVSQAATDIAASEDGSSFASVTNGALQVLGSDLSVSSGSTSAEIEQIPGRTNIPGVAMHPTGALIYQPFLTGPPPAAPPATGIQGGVDILDAHSGRLRIRISLPEPFAALSTDTTALLGQFLAIDENGQRIFAITSSGLTVVQLASVPLGIGTLSPASGPAAGGTLVTLRGSGFKSATTVTLGGKSAKVTFKDMNTLTFTAPVLPLGPTQMVVTNPDGEVVTLDAAFSAN